MTDTTPIKIQTRVDRFSQELTVLQTRLGEDEIASGLQAQSRSLQQQFREILSLAAETAFSPGIEPQIRPCLTEINRLVRLIGLDAAFLKTARQTQTVQARQAQLRERVTQLQALCQALQIALG